MGQAVSQFGDAMYFLVFLFMADRMTGDSRAVAWVGAVGALPYLLLSAYAGVVADRYDRRVVMLASDVVSFFLLAFFAAWLALGFGVPLALLLVMSGTLGMVNVFFAPAKSSAIPRLVPPEQLSEANGLSAATQNLMPLVGLALSGTLLAAIEKGFPQIFFLAAVTLNALTFVFSAACIARLPAILPQPAETHHDVDRRSDFIEGWRYVRRTPVLRASLVITFILNAAISPFMVVYVAVNREWFGGRYGTLATFEASFVAMMLVFSLVLAKRPVRRVGLSVIVANIAVGLLVMAMSGAKDFALFLALNMLCGVGVPYLQIPLQTYLQLIVEDAYRGRVSSLIQMVSLGIQPLSIAVAGFLLHAWGAPAMFLLMGGGLVAGAVYAASVKAFRTAAIPVAS